MNIYIATKFQSRHEATALAHRIRALDLRVLSRWHSEAVIGADDSIPEQDLPHDVLERIAAGNHRDLGQADTLVLLVRPGMRGSLVELGVALGSGKRVIIIGQQRAITPMARHDRVWWCDDEDACVAILARLSGRGRP